MSDLFVFAAYNTLAALVLAICVWGMTRLWRNPAVAHVAWLLVLLKLVAPPLVPIDASALGLAAWTLAGGPARLDDSPASGIHANDVPAGALATTAPAPAQPAVAGLEQRASSEIGPLWSRARPLVLAIWLGGVVACGAVVAIRIVRFEAQLRGTLPASERLRRLATETAGRLGVRRVPPLRYAEQMDVPLLWCGLSGPTIVLPRRLVDRLDDESAAMILAHELAHLRRRDYWVRAVELIVTTVYWWNPLPWAIRRQIHRAEDMCCDAWVCSLSPGGVKRYAEVLLQTAETVSASKFAAGLLPASPFFRSHTLKGRIEMILENRFSPSLPKRALLAIALVGLVVLPSFVAVSRAGSAPDAAEPATATAEKPPAAALEFPYVVHFEQGATRFEDGDTITIDEVRGTSDTFAPSNIYWIKGTYKLGSKDEALLAAYTTASKAGEGRGVTSYKVQTTKVKKGSGTFTLVMPMSYQGWPHVSYYDLQDGHGFGGNYVGTGETVLKKWWSN